MIGRATTRLLAAPRVGPDEAALKPGERPNNFTPMIAVIALILLFTERA